MKYLFAAALLLLGAFVLSKAEAQMNQQGTGYRVSLKAGQPMSIDVSGKRGCLMVKYAGTVGTTQAQVSLSLGGKTNKGPAASVRSVVVAGTSASGSISATADTVVQVLFYDYAPIVHRGSRGRPDTASCFA